jgi:hypothetical protein
VGLFMSVSDHASVGGVVFKAMGKNGMNMEILVENFGLDGCGNFAMVIDGNDLDCGPEILRGYYHLGPIQGIGWS